MATLADNCTGPHSPMSTALNHSQMACILLADVLHTACISIWLGTPWPGGKGVLHVCCAFLLQSFDVHFPLLLCSQFCKADTIILTWQKRKQGSEEWTHFLPGPSWEGTQACCWLRAQGSCPSATCLGIGPMNIKPWLTGQLCVCVF